MNAKTTVRTITLAAAAALGLCAGARADETVGSRAGVSFGGRGTYFNSSDVKDSWGGGAQLRFHLSPVLAIEGSADYREEDLGGGNRADLVPLQASLMVYLAPAKRLSPYLIGGAGWYHTRVHGQDTHTDHRFGPHAGAGLELFLDKHWSIDGDWRYTWVSDLHSQDSAHPFGRDIRDRGSLITAALNYWF